MISGHAECGRGLKALKMYKCMLQAGVEPNPYTFVNLLKACGSIPDLEEGKKLHADAQERGFTMDVFVGSTLVSMYGKCGSLLEAENVFGGLWQRNVVSWNAMLSSYVEGNKEEKALQLYRQMREEGVSPNHLTFVGALQACCTLGDKGNSIDVNSEHWTKLVFLEMGQALHADARRKCFASNAFVGSTLVSMYSKCSCIKEAENVFIGLSERNVVSWNVMLSAYTELGQGEKALQSYRQMQEEGVSPDHQTFMIALQACCSLAEMEEPVVMERQLTKVVCRKICQALHTDTWRKGFAFDVIVGSMLISIYSKCGTITEAENVFGGLSKRDVVAWNAMLSAYVAQGQGERALKLYRQMQEEGVRQDELTIVTSLQACGSSAEKERAAVEGRSTEVISLEIGQALHSDGRKKGFASGVFVGNTLISMYGKCRAIGEAENVFNGLSKRDIVSWNAMLSAYVEQGQGDLALQLYKQMQREGIIPNKLTFATALQACGNAADKEEAIIVVGRSAKVVSLKFGWALHADALIKGFDLDIFVKSTLVSMYGKCGTLMEAEKVFFGASEQDIVSWNVMLTAYVEQGQREKALQLYRLMQECSVCLDERTFAIVLKACSTIIEKEEAVVEGQMTDAMCLEIGQALHAYAWRKGFASNVFVGSTLVSMYSRCGCIVKAQYVFDRISDRNVVLWNTILSAYVEQGKGEKTLQLYREMQEEGGSPDQQTLVIALQACCILAEKEEATVVEGQPTKVMSLKIGRALHADAARNKGFAIDVFVGSTLVSMYGKCGAIPEAEITFGRLTQRNIVSWNAMLSAYVEHNQCDNAIQLYRQMQKKCMTVDDVTFVCILQACSETGSVELCRQVYFSIVSAGGDISPLQATTLVHAYGSCACMVDAESVFKGLFQPDVVAWSTCIAGFGQEGNYEASLQFLKEMHMEDINADEVTYASLLSTCSHAGLVYEGVEYFEFMSRDHGITPGLKHYASMVDLLGRAGNFTRVENMLRKMPMQADLAIWLCLLSACCTHGNLELAKLAFNSAVHLQPKESAGYILMSNIHGRLDPEKLADLHG